jgi:hypothetical protein
MSHSRLDPMLYLHVLVSLQVESFFEKNILYLLLENLLSELIVILHFAEGLLESKPWSFYLFSPIRYNLNPFILGIFYV